MSLNPVGLSAALATFLTVWLGHVAVRKIEARVADIRPPMVFFILLGLGLGAASLRADPAWLSAALGIASVTSFWDAFEFIRQQKRVRRGHAPANPHNPRHARFLAELGSCATTVDIIKNYETS